MDPFNFNSSGLVNLIASQSSQTIDLGCSEVPKPASNKDPIVSNEQKAGTFWRRIEEYVNASPLLIGSVPREWSQCKQRWGMMNEQVCKFVGSHEAALKEQASGQNENDVMKAAHDIFFNDYHVKFSLEHCWRELRFDQKWRSHPFSKDGAKEKRKEPAEEVPAEEDVRPPGVKANKAAKRKKNMNDAAFDQVCRSRVAVGGCVRVDVLSVGLGFFGYGTHFSDYQVLKQSYLPNVKNPPEKMSNGLLEYCNQENERDGYTQIDTSEFESGESSKSSKVKRRTSFNIGNMLGVRNEVRDSEKHHLLKADLVENV
ncbi:glutathione S-transferase T2-like [Brassica napus]|uniref:glutathione S-transferase T2-like n=1 Tax=Brassica oleracea var. oleracea TaxID=109376 RepID=UPI0006A6F585|nr:PREDICTED: glutathione S-transferase T2-like [Brassica oleracea var. oleracea]XP_048611356.1 glutathione S-transferase T2-like [Brassica napus]